ncbi:MAG: hypothetical protein ACFFB3_16195 [Candidatus Hodarchaeota archaeon]
MVELSYDDINLLIALQDHPLASDSYLAKQIGVSQPTATSRLNHLKEKISLYNVHCDLDPDALGMEMVDAVLDIPTVQGLQTLETLCEVHPYTVYRVRKFGRASGLFIQFRIPNGSEAFIENLLKSCQKQKLISVFRILKRASNVPRPIFTRTKLPAWNPSAMKWEFEWDVWNEKLEQASAILPNIRRSESVLSELTGLDVKLLEELTQDARQRNTDIMRKIGFEVGTPGLPQKVSRRLKFLKEKTVAGYRVFLNWEVFDTYHTFVFICKASKEDTACLYNHLSVNPIPFQSSFVILEDGYFWAVQSPPSHFSNVAKVVWKYSEARELLLLDYKTSEVYGLWSETFDSSAHSWRTTIMKPESIFAAISNYEHK